MGVGGTKGTGPQVPGPLAPTTRPRQREWGGEGTGIGVVEHHEDMCIAEKS